tara:strand:- start:2263 stop:5748 length:3486 start_codon:yes stop_codon:yes gene_type:complete
MLLTGHRSQSPREDLLRVIRQVRHRWRLKIVLRGVAVMITASIVAFLLSAYGLEYFRFSAPAIITFRVLTYLTLTLLLIWSLLLPLSRRVSDELVALYLEEHEPSLQASVLSALEESGKPDASSRDDMSPALIRRLIEVTVEKCDSIDSGRAVERRSLQRTSGALVGLAATSAMLLLFGPGYLRHGLSAVAFPHRSIETVSPYKIVVAPGNVTIARGTDQVITAELVGFETEKVELYSRSHASVPYEPLMLVTGLKENQYEVMLFDIGEATDYFVQSSGIRSPVYTIEVIDIPFVERLELEYHFPPYTELPPRTIEDGGDIAVLRGTEVRVRAVPTTETLGGRFVINEETILPMDRQPDGSFKTSFTVETSGFYRIDLEDHDGAMITASSQHTIEVLDDQPPVVGFEKPGRDITASSVEEIFVEAKANDDFGVQALELVYAINGSDDKVLELFNNPEDAPYETSAGYTFFLEEFGLEPGDLISYYARARDSATGDKSNVGTSDLYFIQIRPFGKNFLPAESQAGMGGGGGAGAASPDALSQQQREIVSATFNIVRDRSEYSDEEFRENVVFLALAQGKLREEVQTLLGRLNSRVVNVDPAFVEISEILPQAVTSMQRAEETLQTQNAKDALPPEQHALRMLQRAEATYEEVRVAMESQGGGGGGGSGGRQSAAEDLADLFELELDKLQNQYETLQSAQQQLADTKLDETLERLKELARRQEQEAERQRLRARGQRTASSGSGASQRALADETEEAARQLERLARNESDPDLMQAARQLQKAADAMRRAAVDPGDNGMVDAGAALEQLREAQSRLEQEQSGRLKRNIATALDRVDALAEAERQVADQVAQLDQDPQVRRTQVGPLMGRKDQMSTEVASLERQLDNTSAEFRRDERESSQRLQAAADSIRKNKLKEKIRYSKGVILGRAPEYSRAFEQQIGADIEEIRQALSEAEAAIGQNPADQWAEALEATRDLMRGVQSLEQRVGEAAQRDGPDQDEQQRQSQGDLQQGGQSAQGQRGGGNRSGLPNQGGNRTHAQPGDWNVGPDQVRQFSREYREQAMDAQKLRQLLEQQGFTVDDLDAVIQALREFDDQRIYADANEIARLQTFVNENLKRFEYRLRRENEGGNTNPLFLAGSDEVPSGFRDLIEEYFRRLSQEEPSS